MKNAQEIASRFQEIILNGTWVANTNYKHQLENLDWKTATTPIKNLNTIAILAQHIDYYINNIFKGGTLDIKDKFSFDFSPINSKQQWETFLNKFWNNTEEFISFIEQMSNENLEEDFADAKYGTYRRNIEAMIQHS